MKLNTEGANAIASPSSFSHMGQWYVYVFVFVYLCICVFVYLRICICIYVFVFVYLYLRVCICTSSSLNLLCRSTQPSWLHPLSSFLIAAQDTKGQKHKYPSNTHRQMRIQIRDKYFFIRVGQHRTGPIPASRPKQPPSGRDGGRTAANSSVSANFFSSFILSQKVLGENSDVFFSVFSLVTRLVPEKFQNPFPYYS